MKSLLIGCGTNRTKQIHFPEIGDSWGELVTLDVDPSCKPDVIHDLETLPYPFDDAEFDEIHAYEVLEHCGRQGDWRFFLAQFEELWRIMKPGGYLVASCPMWDSPWAWADPGHTRVLNRKSLVFLSQAEYGLQVGKTHMTDYRLFYKGDLETVAVEENEHTWGFVLRARK